MFIDGKWTTTKKIITGPGETVGAALVRSPIPRLITFTGRR